MKILDCAHFEELNSQYFCDVKPDISVIVNCYNFAEYLPDTLEGIIAQNTDYTIEVLIHDDASNDDSPDIIRDYCRRYPYMFHGFLGRKNIYGTLKQSESVAFELEWLNRYTHGKYVAYCEGDDYWTDKDKLQIQLEYMESHPDCKMIMHEARLINFQDKTEKFMKEGEAEHDISPKELILQLSGIWPTASMLFTRDVALCPEWFINCGVGDWPRQLYAAANGTVHYINRCMSVYRYLHNESWSMKMLNSMLNRGIGAFRMMRFLFQYDQYTGKRFHDAIVERAGRFYMDLIWKYETENEFTDLCDQIENAVKCEGSFFDIRTAVLEVYRIIMAEDYIPKCLLDFISNHKIIYIMGKGELSGILSKKLRKKGIPFEGYVVSDSIRILDDDVKHISDIAQETDVGIVVAIGSSYFAEVRKAVASYKLVACFPFVITDF